MNRKHLALSFLVFVLFAHCSARIATAARTARGSGGISQPAALAEKSGPSPAPQPRRPRGKALKSCGDITRGGNYYLANDVSSAGTCFGIDADNINLNLNGHTITYDTADRNFAPAIEGHNCWSTTNPLIAGPCGPAHGGLEVYGGSIVQSPGQSAFSHVFEFGQGTFRTAPHIHEITATFQNTGAEFYFSRYLPAGAKVENNTINDNVISINHTGQGDLSSRSAFQGQAIYIGQQRNNPGAGDVISGNRIIGSPQGGVYSDNQNTVVSGNDISMNARYANDFCDVMAADHQIFRDNHCHPLSGRGVHVNASNDVVANNTITVTVLKQNMEYGPNGQVGCEGGGTYGVQLEFDSSFLRTPPTGVQVTGNKITANAGDCNAIGLRVTGMTPAGNAVFTGNTVITTNNGGKGLDFAISVDAENGTGVTFTGNTFQSMYAYAGGEWDGYQNHVIGHNTWQGTPTYTFVAADGACDPNNTDHDRAVCPASFTFSDNLPNTVRCGLQSEAKVTIGNQVTQCKAKPSQK